LYTFDDLANGFFNPMFMLIAGGLAHCDAARDRVADYGIAVG